MWSPAEFDAAISAVNGVALPLLAGATLLTVATAVALYEQERAGETPSVRVLLRRARRRLVRPVFVRSASWWVDRAGRTARPARHRARGLARAAVRRRVRRVVLAVAVFVDELTAPARMVVAA